MIVIVHVCICCVCVSCADCMLTYVSGFSFGISELVVLLQQYRGRSLQVRSLNICLMVAPD